jgi:hypothetical protein
MTNKIMKTLIKTTTSELDSLERHFLWLAYSDGSAKSMEIKRHCSDPARRTQCTWEQEHPAGDEMAVLIHAMQ